MQKPQKRKPLHEKDPLNEIVENVKNRATAARAKSKKVDNNVTNDDETNVFTSDDDEEYEGDPHNARNMNTTYNINIGSSVSTQPRRSPRLSQRLSDQNEITKDNEAHNLKQKRRKSINHQQSNNSSSYYFIVIPLLLVILASLIYFSSVNGDIWKNLGNSVNEKELTETDLEKRIQQNVIAKLKSFKKIYKNQEMNLWEDAFVSITDIMREPKKPSIMLLLGNNLDPLGCLAQVFGNISSDLLNSHTKVLKPENFESDMGSVITSLRSDIKTNKVIIIWDLLNINVEALKAFHNLCDRINPLVDEAIYIITIIADDYDEASNKVEFIEKKLYNKLFGKIKEDFIQPLITRMIDGPILIVKPEPTITDCPMPKASRKI